MYFHFAFIILGYTLLRLKTSIFSQLAEQENFLAWHNRSKAHSCKIQRIHCSRSPALAMAATSVFRETRSSRLVPGGGALVSLGSFLSFWSYSPLVSCICSLTSRRPHRTSTGRSRRATWRSPLPRPGRCK